MARSIGGETVGQGSKAEPRRALLGAVRMVLIVLVATAALVAAMFLARRSIHLFDDTSLSNYFAYYQDLAAVPLLLAFFGAILLLKVPTGIKTPLSLDIGRLAILAIAVLIACYAGTYLVFGNFALSMDEFMAGFDAQILRHGELFAPVPRSWQALTGALQPIFLLQIPGNAIWSSSYLPGNAAIRALFALIADPALAEPALAAASIVFLYGVARKLEPDREFAAVAVLLFVTSAQFLLTAATAYAMTAHLALNLAWLWLALHDRAWSRIAALAVSFVACGLHQMVFHPIFVAPFLMLFWLEGKQGAAILYFLAVAAFALFWIAYWPIAISLTLPGAPAGGGHLGGTFFLDRVVSALAGALQRDLFVYSADNLLRLLTWQNPVTLVLVAAAYLTLQRQPPMARALLGGIVLMTVATLLIMPYQGHGWGYRYLHGYLGNFALLAAYGWRGIRDWSPAETARLRFGFALSLPFALLVLLPLRAYQANAFVAPYRNADTMMAKVDADVLIIENVGRWYAQDLVRNDPYLRNRPLRLIAGNLSAAQGGELCRNFHVKVISRFSPELAGLRPFGDPHWVAAGDWRLGRLRGAGCPVSLPAVEPSVSFAAAVR